jgi:hypothetical protein
MILLDTLPVYNTTGNTRRSFIYLLIILLYLSHFIQAAVEHTSTIINDTSSDDEHISYTHTGRRLQHLSISH